MESRAAERWPRQGDGRTCSPRALRLTGGAFFYAGLEGGSFALRPPLLPLPARPPPSGVACRARTAGLSALLVPGPRQLEGAVLLRSCQGSRWGVGSRLHFEQGSCQVSRSRWAWIFVLLHHFGGKEATVPEEVSRACSSLCSIFPPLSSRSFLPSCTPGGGHPRWSARRSPASACFEIVTTAHLLWRRGRRGRLF